MDLIFIGGALLLGLALGIALTRPLVQAGYRAKLATLEERTSRLGGVEASLKSAEERAQGLETALAQAHTRLESSEREAKEKLSLLKDARDELSLQFKTLANDILTEKTQRFKELNQSELQTLLDPLRVRITEFKTTVEDIHRKDLVQQTELKTELARLKETNQEITKEAHELATALKGNKKMQGNWGELILENVLDRSGLRQNVDYRREVSFNTEEGRKRPDVIVYLPEQKHLIIDAKVSLNAYTRYVNADTSEERAMALDEHVKAIENRLKELSNREYFDIPGLNSPDMVFMFIPIESAFVEAMRAKEALFQTAIEMNVLVATPTTLLTSLHIVRSLWRFEEHNSHMAELADRASKVYKKLHTFVSSLEDVGQALNSARASFDTAWGQLTAGRGNLIAQAADFERLGVAVSKALPDELVQKARLELDLDHEPDDN